MLRWSKIIAGMYLLLALIVTGLTALLGPLPMSAAPFPLFPEPTPRPLVSDMFKTDIEIVVERDADDATIRTEFINAYRRKAQETYGEQVTIQTSNINFQSRGGDFQNPRNWEEIGKENGNIRYIATLEAFVQYHP